jgi:Domain of unknown function (DUF4269)
MFGRPMLAALFHDLAAYTPALVGTFPLGLTVAGSDIDIACYAPDAALFQLDLERSLAARSIAAEPRRFGGTVVAGFVHDGTPYEVFAEGKVVHQQAGFRHMIVEGRVLVLGGTVLRARIIEMKRAGTKTEPAFAQVLGLAGDPYAAVLALERSSDDELRGLVSSALARVDHAR